MRILIQRQTKGRKRIFGTKCLKRLVDADVSAKITMTPLIGSLIDELFETFLAGDAHGWLGLWHNLSMTA
jgi:hypothetical protein